MRPPMTGPCASCNRLGAKAFDLSEEPLQIRDAYGRNLFGQGCLLARRLVERGVPFVEVTLGGWDTHNSNFDAVKRQCGILDPAWGQLMTDLDARGLLETTTIIWMGEFGRTPRINQGQGRDHFPNAWSGRSCRRRHQGRASIRQDDGRRHQG